MAVKLKVLHGALKKHGKWQLVVPIKRSPFVIGQASDCDMRCFGRAINDYHCQLRVAQTGVFLRNLAPDGDETRLNGAPLVGEAPILAGDQLQLGRLAFQLLIDVAPGPDGREAFDEYVSQLLLKADEEDQDERLHTLEDRWYRLEPSTATPQLADEGGEFEGLSVKERLLEKARRKIPENKPPQRLPSGALDQVLAPTVEASIEKYYEQLKSQLRS